MADAAHYTLFDAPLGWCSRAVLFVSCLLLSSLIASAVGSAQEAREPYLPLQGAIVLAPDPTDFKDLLDTIDAFGRSHNYAITRHVLPKEGHSFVQVHIQVGTDTFFDVNNFRDADEIFVTVYSHQQKEVWTEPWRELVDEIVKKLGRTNVFVMRASL